MFTMTFGRMLESQAPLHVRVATSPEKVVTFGISKGKSSDPSDDIFPLKNQWHYFADLNYRESVKALSLSFY